YLHITIDHRIFPNRVPRTSALPCIHDIAIGSLPAFHPGEELEHQQIICRLRHTPPSYRLPLTMALLYLASPVKQLPNRFRNVQSDVSYVTSASNQLHQQKQSNVRELLSVQFYDVTALVDFFNQARFDHVFGLGHFGLGSPHGIQDRLNSFNLG